MPLGGYREGAGRPTESKDYYIYLHVKGKGYYISKTIKGVRHYIGYSTDLETARDMRDEWLEANPEYAPKKRKR